MKKSDLNKTKDDELVAFSVLNNVWESTPNKILFWKRQSTTCIFIAIYLILEAWV